MSKYLGQFIFCKVIKIKLSLCLFVLYLVKGLQVNGMEGFVQDKFMVVFMVVLYRSLYLPDTGYRIPDTYLPDTRYPAGYPVDSDIRYSPKYSYRDDFA